MGRKIWIRSVTVFSIFVIIIVSQISPPVIINAAFLNPQANEYFTHRGDFCWTGGCNALLQYALDNCPAGLATSSSNFSKYAQNSGYNGYWQYYTSNNKFLSLSPNAFTFVASLLAYYYGVSIPSGGPNGCAPWPTTDPRWVANSDEQFSGDNIGASFDILAILYSGGYSGSYTYYPSTKTRDAYVTINPTSLNQFVSYIYSMDLNSLVCFSGSQVSVYYNTAEDINSAGFDVGTTSFGINGVEKQPMYGILNKNGGRTCNTPNLWSDVAGSQANQSTYFSVLIDKHCGNLSLGVSQPINTGTCNLVVVPTKNPADNQQVFVYIHWNLPNPQATQMMGATFTRQVNGGAITPIPPIASALSNNQFLGGLNTYTWNNQGNIGKNLVASPQYPGVLNNSTVVNYRATLRYHILGAAGPKTITCTPSPLTITWPPKPPLPVNLCLKNTGLATTAENTYKAAYTNWYNYDSKTFIPDENATAADAKAIATALDQFINVDVAAYNADVANINSIIATYNNTVNADNAAESASINNAATTFNSEMAPATNEYDTAFANYEAVINQSPPASAADIAAATANLNSATNDYFTAFDTYFPSYNDAVNAAVALDTAQNQAALNAENAALIPAQKKEATDILVAEGAYNAISGSLAKWEASSEKTYVLTTIYTGTPPFSTSTFNSGANNAYTNDQNLYNIMNADLVKWNTALKQQDLVCDTKPYFTVTGGDTIAGAGSADTNGACGSNNSADIYASNIGSSPWTGASDNLAALAPNVIKGFSTYNGGNGLTFSNTDASYDPYGGGFGTANGTCSLDYYDTKANLANFSAGTASGPFDISSASNNNACQQIDTTYYCNLSGPIKVYQSSVPAPSSNTRVVLYVNGSAEISSNITIYNYSSGLNYVTDIPLLYVIASQNIYIDNAVTTLDGVYSASYSASGTIFTCADGGSSYPNDQALIFGCTSPSNTPLNVNGSLVASQIKFGRVNGGLSAQYSWPTGPSETFNYGPEVWLSQVNSSFPSTPDYTSVTELSPVL